MNLSPNVWSLGDTGCVAVGDRYVPIVVRDVTKVLVRVEYPDGSQHLRPHSALHRY